MCDSSCNSSPATQDVVPGLSPTAVHIPSVVDVNAMTDLRLAAVHYKLPAVRSVSSLALDCVNSSNAQASDFATHCLASYLAYSIKVQAPETPDHSLYLAQA